MYEYYIKKCYMLYTLRNVSHRAQFVLYTHISMWQCSAPPISHDERWSFFLIFFCQKVSSCSCHLSLVLLASKRDVAHW